MQTNWVISAMDCKVQENGMTNVVTNVHWRLRGVKPHEGTTYTAEEYGCTAVGEPDPLTFTPFEELTQEQVVGWLEQVLDVAAMTTRLEQNIDLQINPVVQTLPPAWMTSPQN